MILIISKLSSIKFKSWSDWSEFGFEPSEDPDGEVGYLSDKEGLLPEKKWKKWKKIYVWKILDKAQIFWEGHKKLPHLSLIICQMSNTKYNFCGILRIPELLKIIYNNRNF